MADKAAKRFENKGFVILGNAFETQSAVAMAAVRQGARVVLSSRQIEPSFKLGSVDGITFIVADTTESGIKHLFDQSMEQLTNFSILVHCLSVPVTTGQSLAQIAHTEWDMVMSICLREPFLSAQCAIQEFLATGEGGRIILMLSSPYDHTTSRAGYMIVQSALYAFTRSIAKEYGRRRIFCNAVTIDRKDGLECEFDSSSDAVMETALFLASDEASFVNGEMIAVGDSTPRNISIR